MFKTKLMRGVETQAQITSISSKADGSLGLRVNTPELSSEEKVLFMSLQNLKVRITIEPMGVDITDKAKIEKGIDGKSPSERLYNVIYVYYKQINSTDDFEFFYRRNMENIIDTYKAKLKKEY